MYKLMIRTIIIYFSLLFLVRVMGKRELSKLSPFDLVIAIMIGELGALPIEEKVTMLEGVVPVALLVMLEMIMAFISLKSNFWRGVITGRPEVLIKNGKIDIDALKKTQYNVNDLLVQLRKKDIFNIQDVKIAILETSGDLTVQEKESGDLTYPVIIDGKMSKNNLQLADVNEIWVNNYLSDKKIDINNVLLATVDEDKKIYIHKKKG